MTPGEWLLIIANFLLAFATCGLFLAAWVLNKITKETSKRQEEYYDEQYLLWVLNNAPVLDFESYKLFISKDGKKLDPSFRVWNAGHNRVSLNSLCLGGNSFSFAGQIIKESSYILSDWYGVKEKGFISLEKPITLDPWIEIEFFYSDTFGNIYRTFCKAGKQPDETADEFIYLILQESFDFKVVKRINLDSILDLGPHPNKTPLSQGGR